MWRVRLAVIALITCALWQVAFGARFSHLNSFANTPVAAAQQKWRPGSTRNNWIILQAGTATTGDAPATANEAVHTSTGYGGASTAPLQGLPVDYYAYNQSAGNYQPLVEDMRDIVEPYVLTFSRSTARSSNAPNSLSQDNANVKRNYAFKGLQSQHLSDHVRQDIRVHDTNGNGDSNGNKDDVGGTVKRIIASNAATTENDVDIEKSVDNTIDSNSLEDVEQEEQQQLNEMLQPLGSALDKVKRFCDMLQHIISDNDDDADSESNDLAKDPTKVYAPRSMSAAETTNSADVKPSQSAAVQGRKHDAEQSLASSAAYSSLLGSGRGLKLKKTLKKLMLPMLLAYKLKFLALVPLLIGGLTLLVGTTGLAGFFFALFTAVMSLKGTGGGGKSIIVKKVYD